VSAGDWIALYAAVVATGALGWSAATYLVGRRPKLRVRLGVVYFVERPDAARDLGDVLGDWRTEVEVVNVGHSTVHVASAGLQTNRGPNGVDVWTSSAWDLPWRLEPSEERVVFLTDEDAGQLTLGQELQASVTTTHGVHFESEPFRVGSGGSRELVTLPETELRRMLGNLPGFEDRTYTMRLHEFGGDASAAERDTPL
jgi:hypothetical protein